MRTITTFSRLILSLLLVCMLALVAACTNASPEREVEQDSEQQGEHDEDTEHDEEGSHDEDEDHPEERIPNEGAVILIVAPADGAAFKQGDDIVVEIETESFVLGEEGNHWEVYVDGSSWSSVEGGNTDEVLRGLEPGEHEISVFMSMGTHEQLEDGDSITVMIEE